MGALLFVLPTVPPMRLPPLERYGGVDCPPSPPPPAAEDSVFKGDIVADTLVRLTLVLESDGCVEARPPSGEASCSGRGCVEDPMVEGEEKERLCGSERLPRCLELACGAEGGEGAAVEEEKRWDRGPPPPTLPLSREGTAKIMVFPPPPTLSLFANTGRREGGGRALLFFLCVAECARIT